ncbi:MAG: hypothetical protein IEMM0002_0401 [bacterium]|nr:MAG: hypothetical protein IEMM0002_0401 [bacterium]
MSTRKYPALRKYPNVNEISSKIVNKNMADEIEILPNAMGRKRFSGWFLSDSTSAISLRMYTALEIRQNKNTPANDLTRYSLNPNLAPTRKGANTKKFFTQCFIRIVFNTAVITLCYASHHFHQLFISIPLRQILLTNWRVSTHGKEYSVSVLFIA